MNAKSRKTVRCPRCASRFRWREELSGRLVECRCGKVFRVEASAATNDAADAGDAGVYDLYEDDEHVAPKSAPGSIPAQAIAASANTSDAGAGSGQAAAVPVARVARIQAEEADEDDSLVRNLYIPIILLVIGVALRVAQLILWPVGKQSMGVAFGMSLLEMVLSVGVMFIGMLMAVLFFEIPHGRIGLAILKIISIAVFTAGVSGWSIVIDNEPGALRGQVLALHVIFILYFILLTFLFKLDLQESMMTVVVIFVLQLGLIFAMRLA